jgi:hypothetical protein
MLNQSNLYYLDDDDDDDDDECIISTFRFKHFKHCKHDYTLDLPTCNATVKRRSVLPLRSTLLLDRHTGTDSCAARTVLRQE